MATGAIVAGAALVGTGLQIYGQYKEGEAREEAAHAQADANRAQAVELLERSEINIGNLRREGSRFKERQRAAFAAGGVDVGSGASLVQLEQTNRDIARQVSFQRREAAFKADQLFRGADVQTDLAGDIKTASQIGMLATGIGGIGRAAGSFSTSDFRGGGGGGGGGNFFPTSHNPVSFN